MIPGPVCLHFFPGLRRQCDAGLRAPHDCGRCPAYHDGTPYLGTSETDQQRERAWGGGRVPRAHFRGDPLPEAT